MRFLLTLALMLTPVAAAEFAVMHGSSVTVLDKSKNTVAYAEANGLDPSTAPLEYATVILAAEKIADTATDLGIDPTNGQKVTALNGMSTSQECRAYLDNPEADVSSPPVCFLTWEDTTVGVNDCQTLLVCATPGAQLCSAVSGEHTLVKRNVAGTRCTSGCQQPSMRLRVRCQ